MNKKIVGIFTVVCVIAVAVFLFAGKKENNVDTGTTSIETVVEDTTVDINDVLPDTELDITVEEVDGETNEEGVSDEAEVVDEETNEDEKSIVESEKAEESIVESESTEPDPETAPDKAETTPDKAEPTPEQTKPAEKVNHEAKNSTEVQDVKPSNEAPIDEEWLADLDAKLAAMDTGSSDVEIHNGPLGDGSAAGVDFGDVTWQ